MSAVLPLSPMICRPIKIANEMTFVVFSPKLILNFSPLDLLDWLAYDSISFVFQPNVMLSSVISGRTKLDKLRKHRTIEAFWIFNQHATCPLAMTSRLKRCHFINRALVRVTAAVKTTTSGARQNRLLTEETGLIQTGYFTSFHVSAGNVQSIQMNFFVSG